jgi:hypothetical protein
MCCCRVGSFCFVNLEIDYHHDVVGDYAEQGNNSYSTKMIKEYKLNPLKH